MNTDELIEAFYSYATGVASIDEKGIYPHKMVALRNDGTMEVDALAMDPGDAFELFIKKIAKKEVQAAMLGLDRTTKPGQGTEFADVLTCYLWAKEKDWTEPGEWRKWFKIGVINYQHEPRIVRPIDWENTFWNGVLMEQINGLRISRRSTGQEL